MNGRFCAVFKAHSSRQQSQENWGGMGMSLCIRAVLQLFLRVPPCQVAYWVTWCSSGGPSVDDGTQGPPRPTLITTSLRTSNCGIGQRNRTKNNPQRISRNEAEGIIWQCSKCCTCQCLMVYCRWCCVDGDVLMKLS